MNFLIDFNFTYTKWIFYDKFDSLDYKINQLLPKGTVIIYFKRNSNLSSIPTRKTNYYKQMHIHTYFCTPVLASGDLLQTNNNDNLYWGFFDHNSGFHEGPTNIKTIIWNKYKIKKYKNANHIKMQITRQLCFQGWIISFHHPFCCRV